MPLEFLPNPGQTLAGTRNDIRANFVTINDTFLVNHVGYTSGADSGKHKFLTMPEQGAAPVTGGNEAALYAAVGADSAQSELVFRRENNGVSIPFTECVAAINGWTRLPSGILLQWGTANLLAADGAGTLVNFPLAFTNAASVYNVQMTEVSAGNTKNWLLVVSGSFLAASFRAKGFDANQNRSNVSVYWTAIGS